MRTAIAASIVLAAALFIATSPVATAARAGEHGIHLPTGRKVSFNWYVTDGAGFRWDISSSGQVSDGTNDAYDGGMQLRVNGSSYSASSSNGTLGKSGREVEIGPYTRGSTRIWRRVYVDPKIGYARWIDIFQNTGSSAQNINIKYYSNLGGTISVTTTTTGKQAISKQDWGIVTGGSSSSSRPAIAHVFSNKGSRMKPSVQFNRGTDDFYVSYSLKIPAGKTVAICQYEAQRKTVAAGVKFLKEFKPRRELEKVPVPLRRIIVNMGGASLTMGNIDLPRHDKHDLAILRNEDELLGTILNKRFDIETSFGRLNMPAARVVGLSVPAADDPYVQLVLLDGQMIAGKLLNPPLRLKLTNGNEMSLPPENLSAATFALSSQRPAEIKITRPTVILRSGQQMAFRLDDLNLTFKTLYGSITLNASNLTRLELDTPDGGLHRAIFRNGSVLSGLLATESLKLTLDLGPALDIPRQVVAQFLFPAEEADQVGLCEMSLRNENTLYGRIADESLAVDTQYGKVTVSPADLAELLIPEEAGLGQVAIKLHNGTTVSGKLVGGTVLFKIEPGPKLPVFLGHIVQMDCPEPKNKPAKPKLPSRQPTPPQQPRRVNLIGTTGQPAPSTRPTADRAARVTAAKAHAADKAASLVMALKQQAARLKAIRIQKTAMAATAKKLAKKPKSKEVAAALEANAKAQAALAKAEAAIRKKIADIQKAMLKLTPQR